MCHLYISFCPLCLTRPDNDKIEVVMYEMIHSNLTLTLVEKMTHTLEFTHLFWKNLLYVDFDASLHFTFIDKYKHVSPSTFAHAHRDQHPAAWSVVTCCPLPHGHIGMRLCMRLWFAGCVWHLSPCKTLTKHNKFTHWGKSHHGRGKWCHHLNSSHRDSVR